MSDQQSTPEQKPDNNRRRVVQTMLVSSPILATLNSRPVQAVQGLSNMLSGNASSCRGDLRHGGMSPGFWNTPNGKTDIYADDVLFAWQLAGYDYGNLKKGEDGNSWSHYKDGTMYIDVFGADIPNPNRPMRQVIAQDEGSDQFHLIAGLLNASYFEVKAGAGVTEYIFTVDQFWALYNGAPLPAAYVSLRDLIESNYHFAPGSDCGVSGT